MQNFAWSVISIISTFWMRDEFLKYLGNNGKRGKGQSMTSKIAIKISVITTTI